MGSAPRLELREGLRIAGQLQRVEGPAGVDLVQALAQRAAANPVRLDGAHQDHLTSCNGSVTALIQFQERLSAVWLRGGQTMGDNHGKLEADSN